MYQDKTIVGIITARGGSKGIPRKNIRPFCGAPLISWTIAAAHASTLLDRVIVSTDDEAIVQVAEAFGASVPFRRPAELATDTATSLDVVVHSLTWLRDHDNVVFDYAMILQPTSPLRTAADIDGCIQKIVETNADSVMSMVQLVDISLSKIKMIDGDRIRSFQPEGKVSARRDELSEVYKRNCAVYLTRTALLMSGDLFGADSRAYLMPSERSVDINTPYDFLVAETFCRTLGLAKPSPHLITSRE